jgi:HTH-type transcriptional regulator/antitoxin HigA
LARIYVLWGAKSGTPQGNELDVLADLADAYENRHHQIGPGRS